MSGMVAVCAARPVRRLVGALLMLAACAVLALPVRAADVPRIALKDPDGRLVDPFLAAEGSAAIVFLFASIDCPVSNRYAPEVARIHAAFAPKRVSFWLVYPNPGDTPDAVRTHLKDFSYPVHALLDPHHDLVKLAKAGSTVSNCGCIPRSSPHAA